MIEEAAVAGRVGAGGVLRRGPEEAQGRECPISGLGAVDPAVFDADRIRRQRESNRGDARERRGGPAVGGQAVGRRGQVPEEVEGAVLQGVEECSGIGCDARAPGVTRTASEDQGKSECAEASNQKLYSTPSCT